MDNVLGLSALSENLKKKLILKIVFCFCFGKAYIQCLYLHSHSMQAQGSG